MNLAAKSNPSKLPLRLLLADDDRDDCMFFRKALYDIPIPLELNTVHDGEKLMEYLNQNKDKLPDILVLDLNMPRKNGSECLIEIKQNAAFASIPVIICSTSLHESGADELYKNGAYYYIRKVNLAELKQLIQLLLTRLLTEGFVRPSRSQFFFGV
jgi:CheY-like chemotaxis protein